MPTVRPSCASTCCPPRSRGLAYDLSFVGSQEMRARPSFASWKLLLVFIVALRLPDAIYRNIRHVPRPLKWIRSLTRSHLHRSNFTQLRALLAGLRLPGAPILLSCVPAPPSIHVNYFGRLSERVELTSQL